MDVSRVKIGYKPWGRSRVIVQPEFLVALEAVWPIPKTLGTIRFARENESFFLRVKLVQGM